MNYTEFSQLTRSQKITLAVIKAKQKLKTFTASGAPDWWSRTVPYIVSNVTFTGFDSSLFIPAWSYDQTTSTLSIYYNVDPSVLDITVEYSFFFSDFPVNKDVEYQPRLIDIGALKLELDTENTGIAIESDSSIKLENTDGYFDSIFDVLTWENQECLFYSWSQVLPWSERRLIYKGYISTKSFSDKSISFSIKDSFVKLREVIPFTGSRLIYGKAKNLDCSLLNPYVGYTPHFPGHFSGLADRDLLTGTITGTATGVTVTGSSTFFTSQLTAGDKIRVIDGFSEYSYTVASVASNTSFDVTSAITVSFTNVICRNTARLSNIITSSWAHLLDTSGICEGDKLTIDGTSYTVKSVDSETSLQVNEQIKTSFSAKIGTVYSSINYYGECRGWRISSHQLARHTAVVTFIYNDRSFSVDNIYHIEKGDSIYIGFIAYTVTSVSNNIITVNQSIITTLSIGSTVSKPASQKVSYNDKVFTVRRDYIEATNDTTNGCYISFLNTAEFNVADINYSPIVLSFTNGSRIVSCISSTDDLTQILKPRDWVKADSTSTSTWYEVLSVGSLSLTLRLNYNETRSITSPLAYKSPDYIGPDSKILVDCMGKKTGDVWIETASDAVRDILLQTSIYGIDEASFAQAKIDAPQTISLVYPTSLGGTLPIARDMILAINKSVFGSLYSNSYFNIAYSILTADRNETYETIGDDDILSFTTSTKNQILKTVNSTYALERGTSASSSYSFSNENISGIETVLAIELALYDQADAEAMTQRYAFVRSSAQTVIAIKGKLNLVSKSLNDRVYLGLSRLFKRFGSSGNTKTGVVNMISKDSTTVDLQIMDNLFSRVGSIAPNGSSDYLSATEDEISRYCYIVDNDTECPGGDESLGSNLIG